MSEWWTYRLSSFLLFSPRTYYRLFELYNAAVWPAQILALLTGVGVVILVLRPGPGRSRWIAAALSACWLWCAVAFLGLRYAKINWTATYFAWAFAAEALLLVLAIAVGGWVVLEPPAGAAARTGLGMLVFAVGVLPLASPLLGRGWRSAEVFGLAPDPTAIATLGALLVAGGRSRWPLMALPILWCLFTGATLLAMKAPDFWIAPLAAALAMTLAALQRRRTPSKT